jgi:hypothetical protein
MKTEESPYSFSRVLPAKTRPAMCDTSSVSAAQNSAVQTQIMISVLGKAQAADKQAGQAIQQMLQSAAQIGKTLDTGKQLDLYA